MSSSDETLISDSGVTSAPVVPGIVLGGILGSGGMASVYEGLDQGFSPPRRVAVKLMSAQISSDPDFRARFEREASLVADFRHDNIVRVYASGELNGTKYIVMEYLSGGTLGALIERSAPLGAAETARIGSQLGDALAYAHERGVVHRDFKPGNVLFTAEGKPVLSDFGVAKSARSEDAQLTRHASVIGAPRYMAPEQERCEPVTDRADVYSFGLTLYEMLTRDHPPSRERMLKSPAEGTRIRESLASLRGPFAELICRCLLLDPQERPSARECARELSSAETSLTSIARADSSSRGTQRLRLALLGGTLLVGAIAVGATVYYSRHADELSSTDAVRAPVPTSPAPNTDEPVVIAIPATEADNKIPSSCGSGSPQDMLTKLVQQGLHAKVQYTLAADPSEQRQAATTLQRQVACLDLLARRGITSDDGDNLRHDAKALFDHPPD